MHILTNKRHYDKLVMRCEQETYFDFKIHEINELYEREKIDVPDEQDFSSGLFCYLATKKLSANHYAQPKERRYFQHYRAGLGLRVASVLLLAVGVGMAMASAAKGWIYSSAIDETRHLEQKYKAKYNQLSENRIDSTTSTTAMQHIVQTIDSLEQRYLRDPEEMFALISQDVSIFPDIRVRQIEWFVSNYSDSKTIRDVEWGKTRRGRSTRSTDPNAAQAKQGFFEIATVEGEFLNFDGNFRYALAAVDDLEKTMRESGKYFSVEIIKRPLNIESDNSLTGDASSGATTAVVRAEVGFRVVREIPQP